MFVSGFTKTAFGVSKPSTSTSASSPRTLQALTGAPAIRPFGNPIGKFGQRPRTGLMSISRLKDGLR